jgi:membrane associated rhomboid family serine protease
MAHHHNEEEEKSYDFIYYLVGLVAGLFTGAILNVGFIYALLGGVLGLLTAAFYLNVLVKGREEA